MSQAHHTHINANKRTTIISPPQKNIIVSLEDWKASIYIPTSPKLSPYYVISCRTHHWRFIFVTPSVVCAHHIHVHPSPNKFCNNNSHRLVLVLYKIRNPHWRQRTGSPPLIKFLAPQSPHRYSTPRGSGMPDGVVLVPPTAVAADVAFISSYCWIVWE